MLRAIGALIMAALYLIVTLPYLGILGLLRKKWPTLGDRTSFRMVQLNIPKDRPVLFVGNHRSYFDVILTYPQLPPITAFVAKSDFEKVPILPIWMKRLYCEFLVKDDIRQNLESIVRAIGTVKKGVSMFIFPEGKRNTGDDERELLPFHEGSFKIATKTKCAIVPVAICGTRDLFENHFPKVKGGHVIIEYGKPIETAQMTREELKGIGAKTRELVQEMVVKNHDRL